ncbi:transposase [Roseiarcaceae bacterium H3SJ34-1]|uniref:transposase n=1 Tax=Terripilifer ovatus TaxID=3032367 RepID=UPI003AB9A143|nr:transposase [Roseiarcaceae bacterium H3SJ34-1]
MSKDDEEAFRRIEVFTGAGRRRSWSRDDKARIVAESHGEGETVSAVARRHGISAQQLFGWHMKQAVNLKRGLRETPAAVGIAQG